MLAGDYNVIPEDRDTFSRRAMANDALFQPESQAAFRRARPPGLDRRAARAPSRRGQAVHLLGLQAGAWQRDAGFRIDHLLCSPQAADRLRGAGSTNGRAAEEKASDHAPTWIELGLERAFSINPVGVVDRRAGQFGDRHHPLIVLQHPAELAVR